MIQPKGGKPFASTYDPAKSRNWKDTVATFALAAGVKPTAGPVTVSVYVYLPRPKTLCRKKDKSGTIWAPVRPDADNYGKGIMDALNGIAYADDGQVCRLTVCKQYHEIGGMPRTEVEIVDSQMEPG